MIEKGHENAFARKAWIRRFQVGCQNGDYWFFACKFVVDYMLDMCVAQGRDTC
jgi:hypothetical protein